MQFTRAEKILHDDNNFNPPPGYYASDNISSSYVSKPVNNNSTFGKQQRFNADSEIVDSNRPGPGSYYNDRAARIKKRMLEDAKKQENINGNNKNNKANSDSQIKISSIPSIPKKSATRVYEELAPGILILHEEQNQGSSIGPGSYNIKTSMCYKKPVAHKINPEPKIKSKKNQEQPEVIVPKIADEIREQRRQMYKKQLFKSSGINKSMISPSDLCLEVIILRQKLLRSDENPPPGYYFNEKYQTSFKEADPDLLPQYQMMMGREQRFRPEYEELQTGPGDYDVQANNKKNNQGGYIPKQQRKFNTEKKLIPGPGSYKIEPAKAQPSDPKGNYPPIFGAGCNRFYSVQKASQFSTPGPGSYQISQPRKKKQKILKIKKNFYNTQIEGQKNKNYQEQLISMGGDRGRSDYGSYQRRKTDKTSHIFSSKVDRFNQERQKDAQVGPGMYEVNSSITKNSYNRNRNGYVGQKQPRFDQSMIRPNIGPGTYFKA